MQKQKEEQTLKEDHKMKKLLALLLALAMVFCLVACGGGNDEEPETPDDSQGETEDPGTDDGGETPAGEQKPFKYGFISWGTADEHGRTLAAATQWAVEAAGGEFVMDGSAVSAEQTIAAAENLIQGGCDIISFCTYAGEASVPQISKLCQENEVYWTMWDTTIADESIQEMINQDPYFVGTANEDQYSAGYDTMQKMAEAGATDVIVVKYGVNIPTCDDRCEGAYDAAEELGINMLYEIVAPEDYKAAMQNALVAYPEANAAFLAGSGTQSTAVSAAFEEAGKSDYVIGAFDYFDSMGEMLQDGSLKVINGGHMVTGTFTAVMGINAFFGTPLSEEKYSIVIPYLTLTSYEDYELYIEYASEGAAYTSEELQQNCFPVFNPDVTLESFQEFVSNWSIEDIAARKGAEA